jgi:anti-anti-sigma factor
MDDEFRVTTRPTDSAELVVTVAGELDAATRHQLSDAVAASTNGSRACVIDLSEVTFMDAGGIRAILECRDWMQARGGTVTLVGVVGEVERVLRLARLDGVLVARSRREFA